MIQIKKIQVKDAEKALEYCKIVGSETDNLLFGKEGVGLTLEQEAEFLRNIVRSKYHAEFVAWDNDQMVGLCNFVAFQRKRVAHRGEFGISVRKAYWGKGVGSMLMKEMLHIAKNIMKLERISLEVRSDNLAAITLYQKFGFQKICRLEDFMKIDGKYVDCDLMQVKLS